MPGTSTPAEPSRARTAASSLAAATRWSSGPSTATVELVSVSPYAFTKSVPGNSVRARSMMRAGIGAPPYASDRKGGTAASGTPISSRYSTTRASIVGTTSACVIRSSRTAASHDCGVKVVRWTTRRPAYRFDTVLDTPAMWYGGTLTRLAAFSSALANSTVVITYDDRCRCRSTAAFGAAVVPDV